MKIRQGFVSNSSSSSFTLALPKGTRQEDIYNIMLKNMEVPKTSIIFDIAKDIAKTFADSIDKELDIDEELKETKEYLKKYKGNWERDWIDKLNIYKEKGMVIFQGGFCNDNGAIEEMLCYSSMEINRDDIYFENSGGY